MARVTVEDCLQHVNDHFDLVKVASKRARLLLNAEVDPIVHLDNDKMTVVALREIASGLLSVSDESAAPASIFQEDDQPAEG